MTDNKPYRNDRRIQQLKNAAKALRSSADPVEGYFRHEHSLLTREQENARAAYALAEGQNIALGKVQAQLDFALVGTGQTPDSLIPYMGNRGPSDPQI